MSAPQLLRHLHLPSVTPFSYASAIQSKLVSQFLSYKALISSPEAPNRPSRAPQPTLLTFIPTPVYTLGRREIGSLNSSQTSHLQAPLLAKSLSDPHNVAEVQETLRGGQITFHGPGQLVIYPILDLKGIKSEKWPKGLSVRCYVNLLEEVTIRTLAAFQIDARRTENPGVWVSEEKKIAALGVHLRRNITSYGVGLNIDTDLRWFDRIVACGLEGKKMTSIVQCLKETETIKSHPDPTHVANIWAGEFARGLWGHQSVLRIVDSQERYEILEGFGDEKLTKEKGTAT